MKNLKIISKKKNKNPFFSIITVVKNDHKNINKTIKSIKNQRYKNFEYIIIDGKSNDRTIKEIKKFKSVFNILVSKKDKGIYHAMNKGAKIAKGKIIVFVNSGDTITKNALQLIQKIFLKWNVDFVFGTVKRYYTTGPILKHGFDKDKLFINFDFATAHSTGFYIKNTTFKNLKYFNTKYKCSADYDLYYRLVINKKRLGHYTKKNQLIGIVKAGGFSSKFTFFQHLIEEVQIRLDNKQNKFLVVIVIINALIKRLLKIFF